MMAMAKAAGVAMAKVGPTKIGEFSGKSLLRNDMRKEAEELIGQLQEKLKEEIIGTGKKKVKKSHSKKKSKTTISATPTQSNTIATPKDEKKVTTTSSANTTNAKKPPLKDKDKEIQPVQVDSTISLFKTKSKLAAQNSDTNANIAISEFSPLKPLLPVPLTGNIKSILHKPRRSSSFVKKSEPIGPEPAQFRQVSPTLFARLTSRSRSTQNKQVSFSGGVKGGSQPSSRPESQAQITTKKKSGTAVSSAGTRRQSAKKAGSGLNLDKKSEKIKGKAKVPPPKKKKKGPAGSQLSFHEARASLDLADTPVPIIPVVGYFEQGKPMDAKNQNDQTKEYSGIYVSSSKDLATTSGTGTDETKEEKEQLSAASVAGKKKKSPKRSSRVKRKAKSIKAKG